MLCECVLRPLVMTGCNSRAKFLLVLKCTVSFFWVLDLRDSGTGTGLPPQWNKTFIAQQLGSFQVTFLDVAGIKPCAMRKLSKPPEPFKVLLSRYSLWKSLAKAIKNESSVQMLDHPKTMANTALFGYAVTTEVIKWVEMVVEGS